MSLKRVTRHKKDGSVALMPLSRHKTSFFVAKVWIVSRTDGGFRAGAGPGLSGLVFGGLAHDFFVLAGIANDEMKGRRGDVDNGITMTARTLDPPKEHGPGNAEPQLGENAHYRPSSSIIQTPAQRGFWSSPLTCQRFLANETLVAALCERRCP